MTIPKAAKRKYDSSRRQAAARRTRLQILRAARKLFLQRGYAGATIEAIAREAGIAKETIYAIFRNKQTLLADLLDLSVGSAAEPARRTTDGPGTRAPVGDTDRQEQVRRFASHEAEVISRAAPIFEVTRVAAKTEPQIARRLKQLYQQHLDKMRGFARQLAANGRLRDRMDTSRAADILWGLCSPELYQLMTQYGRWSKSEYADWLAETLERVLLP